MSLKVLQPSAQQHKSKMWVHCGRGKCSVLIPITGMYPSVTVAPGAGSRGNWGRSSVVTVVNWPRGSEGTSVTWDGLAW